MRAKGPVEVSAHSAPVIPIQAAILDPFRQVLGGDATTTRMKNLLASTLAGLSKRNAESRRPAKGTSTFSCRCVVMLVQATLYPITLPP